MLRRWGGDGGGGGGWGGQKDGERFVKNEELPEDDNSRAAWN